MSKLFPILTALLLPLATWASDSPAPAVQSSARAVQRQGIGALARDIQCNLNHPATGEPITQAVEIIDVQVNGASYQKGLRSGDLLLSINGSPVRSCDEIKTLFTKLSDQSTLELVLLRDGHLIHVSGDMQQYRDRTASTTSEQALQKASELFDRNQSTRPVKLNQEHRAMVGLYARAIKQELSQAPEGTNARAIIRNMQNIRNVFRDSNSQSQGWMKGKAGEATLQFKKGPYVLILKGMNNLLRLEVYNQSGSLIFAGPMDTPEQRQAVPANILSILQAM
ncbi:MAG: PDZ domain-containing protein [Akkermansia sp.]